MARGINKVILVGNCGKDPESRSLPSGGNVTNITVATTESWKDKTSGEKQERTEWHNIVMYNKLGEIAAQYLKKGQQVYLEGSIRTRKWQDKDGKDRYTTEIIASDMQMLGGKGGGGGSTASYDGGERSSAPAAKKSSGGGEEKSFEDDDIPF